MGMILNVDSIEENVNITDEKIHETLGDDVGVVTLENGFLLYNIFPAENALLNNYTTMLLSQNILSRNPGDICFLGTAIFAFLEEIDLNRLREVE